MMPTAAQIRDDLDTTMVGNAPLSDNEFRAATKSGLWQTLGDVFAPLLLDLEGQIDGGDSALAAHVAASDPHTGYQRESERGAANGYASLDSGGVVPTAQIPPAYQIRETGGPTTLTVGAVADGQILGRNGSTAEGRAWAPLVDSATSQSTTAGAGADTTIAFTLAAGTYRIWGRGLYQTASPGVALRSTFAASGGLTASSFLLEQAAQTGALAAEQGYTTTLGTFTNNANGSPSASPIRYDGYVVVTVGGTMTLRIASESDGTNVQLDEVLFVLTRVA